MTHNIYADWYPENIAVRLFQTLNNIACKITVGYTVGYLKTLYRVCYDI
jgi:hypothetical protein